ncbi:LysM peptidoglycan-binding domain-containing protein [Sphingobium limneticum]|uniref:LysM peptidoglycan-binding domain-containing protein n=2 Tax=Sphingobium limneticum TaxID=1007511 RepID=A0A5J5I0E4_9SPHN|nr:LysM peptidoglycan-binding domain-containing protein [Sphingobium limneticum]KAA9027915.1 LysM peptidoglycan-binding domain-containing protein [Sphingobium limneticum]
MQKRMSGELVAFSLYLRTGRRIAPPGVEVKFNPWHDEENGRFTFAGQGRYFGRGGSSPHGGMDSPGKSRNDDGGRDRSRNRPDHPDNYAFYTVQSGDSLSRIAARRKGLTTRDLAWLNQQGVDQPLRIGQQIKLPHQAYLDRGRAAKNHFLGLAHFMDRHGGNLPPDPSKAPSLESQILDANWKRETKNGYDFHIDVIARSRRIFGPLSLAVSPVRSRHNQAQAGKPNRLGDDDGGHFIAARFNGPSDSFNHFAQNSNFNRGSYRVMEDLWAKELRAKHKVFVDIEPLYHGASKRPYQLNVYWEVDGKKFRKKFPNEAKGAKDGKR